MQFYFVDEDNWTANLSGDNNEILDKAIEFCNIQPKHTGFIAALDMTGRIRGTLAWSSYTNHSIKLYAFIRKYRAIESLETLSKMIQEDITKGIIGS